MSVNKQGIGRSVQATAGNATVIASKGTGVVSLSALRWLSGITRATAQNWGRYHGGRRPSSDDSLHSPTVIPPSALDKLSIMKRYHRWRLTRWGVTARLPTMVTLRDCLSSADGGMTVGLWRLSSLDGCRPSMIPAPEVWGVTIGVAVVKWCKPKCPSLTSVVAVEIASLRGVEPSSAQIWRTN